MSTIVLRSVKGSGLTNNEIDANFTNLNTDKVEAAQTVALTNKTLALGSNTISGTLAQFNTAVTDADLASLAGTETLTNKTLTSPAINGGVIDTTSTTATAAVGTSSTRLANTAFVQQEKEYLPALSQSLHIGAVVKAIVYDTSKDSDGGAWRKRCADKSWYTETLGGDRWIGQHATISAAWTAAGSTTGAVYQASATAGSQTSGLYYTPTSSTTVTQVYRGVTREFPAVAGIVAESTRVVIYDLATGAMWLCLTNNFNGGSFTGVAAMNGEVAFAKSTCFASMLFVQDKISLRVVSGVFGYLSSPNIALRNASWTANTGYTTSGAIVNNTVNDVAITVLDNAVIDPATGLPAPTIAVATAAGTSIILDSGTVVNKTYSATASIGVRFGQGATIWISFYSGNALSWNYYTDLATSTTLSTKFNNQGWAGVYNLLGVTSDKIAELGLASLAIGGSLGLNRTKGFGSVNGANNMVAAITTAYNTGWLPGDIRGAYLADTTAETVTASGELVTNGTFAANVTDWTAQGGGAIVWNAGGSADVTAVAYYAASIPLVCIVGKTYSISLTSGANGRVYVSNSASSLASTPYSSGGTSGFTEGSFVATQVTHYLHLSTSSGAGSANYDNISVKLAEPDRSVKNKGLVINGSLTKTAVASGAGLVAWSGFSASNYCEQPYNSDLDFGTGDFCVMGWVNATVTARLYARGIVAGALAMAIDVVPSTGTVNIYKSSGFWLASSASAFTSGQTFLLCVSRTSGTVTISVNGVVVATATSDTTNLTLTNAVTRFGVALDGTIPLTSGSMALWRISATAPSQSQIEHIYRTELPLFQASAQCTIAGSSTAVTALAYDDTTELLHVGTSWGRTGFKDLLRVDSEATTTGALTSLSASQGVIITGGTSGKVYVPAMLLRDELRRKDEARKALGRVPVFFDYTATASQTAFVAPKGYAIKAVYHNGTLKRETTTGVYWVRSTDGFAETCTLSAGATVSDWISLMCVRT